MLINRLLKADAEVYWLKSRGRSGWRGSGHGSDLGSAHPPPPARCCEKGAQGLGVTVHAVAKAPAGEALKLKPIRIGLYDQYGGSMPSGWTRWLFEQYEFPFEVVYPATLDAGDLKSKFDVLVFTDGAIRRGGAGGRGGGGGFGGARSGDHSGRISRLAGPHLRRQDHAAAQEVRRVRRQHRDHRQFHQHRRSFGLPVKNYLSKRARTAKTARCRGEKFYIPGSLLKANVDNTNPLAYGMPPKVDVFFDNSPVFRWSPLPR